jgi:SAM-dependent methyltransferase
MIADTARFFDAMAREGDQLEPWYEHLYAVLHPILRAELAPRSGRRRPRALDAGCGTGGQTGLLAELGYETHGIDISAGSLAVARGRVGGAALAQADLLALPYRDARFDAVVCCGSTLSFVSDPARSIAEIGRVLSPGGRLLLECEHKWSLDLGWALVSSVAGDRLGYGVTARGLWHLLARPRGEGFWLDYPGYPAIRLVTRAELDGWLAAAGLVPIRRWGVHALTNLIPSTVLHRRRLTRGLAIVNRALRTADRAVGRSRLAQALANSLVVLAQRA